MNFVIHALLKEPNGPVCQRAVKTSQGWADENRPL